MSYSVAGVIENRIKKFLSEVGLLGIVDPHFLARQVLEGTIYWELKIEGKEFNQLVMFKLFSPVVMREEVFLGSVLLNCFLSQGVLRACDTGDIGRIAMVGNDIENFYYLWATSIPFELLKKKYLGKLEEILPDLYFGEKDEGCGFYGNINKMFEFHKNNIEAFPIFAIPSDYVNKLGEIARSYLKEKIADNAFQRNPTTITANLSFFLSKEGDENQSPYLLLVRAASRYNVLTLERLKETFNLTGVFDLSNKEGEKKLATAIKESLSKQKFSPEKVKKLFIDIVNAYEGLSKKDPLQWSISYCRGKSLQMSPAQVISELLSGCQMGHLSFTDSLKTITGTMAYCRSCGSKQALLVENHIIMGEDVGKFHNHSSHQVKGTPLKICVKCCVDSYLIIKLVGNTAGSLAFVPQQSSIIFHYGRHTEAETADIANVLKEVFDLIRKRRNHQIILNRLEKEKRNLAAKVEDKKGERVKSGIVDQITTNEKEVDEARAGIEECNELLLSMLGFTEEIDNIPALEIINDANIKFDRAEHYIFGIGMGDYRMMAFILPEFKHGIDKKAHDFVQQRFNNSRVTVLTVLSFLRKVCGCDGPWYYLTLPVLSEDGLSTDAFYVRTKKYSAQEVSEYYEAFTGFANKVVRWDKDILVRKIILSEKMLDDPLSVLSDVLRKSAALSKQKDSLYNVIFNQETHRSDLNSYLRYFKLFQKYQYQDKKEG